MRSLVFLFSAIKMIKRSTARAQRAGGFCLLAPALLWSGVALAAEPLSLTEGKTAADNVLLTVRHPAYTLQIVPAESGRGIQLTARDGAALLPKDDDGLFRECFNEESLQAAPPSIHFTHKAETNDVQTIRLALTATLATETAGADLAGVVLTRTLAFRAGSPAIEVETRLTNPTKEARYAGFGLLQRFGINPRGNDLYYLPSTRNIQEVAKQTVRGYYAKASPWEYEPVAGWLAARDSQAERGLVFLMDYDPLESFYTAAAGGAMGWYVDGGELAPGGSFAAKYRLIPFRGFKGLVHASDHLLADIQVTPQANKIVIQHTLASLTALTNVTVKTSVYGVRTKKTVELEAVVFPTLGGEAATKAVAWDAAQSEPLVIRATVQGTGWQETYETYHEGKFLACANPGYPYQCEYVRPKPARKVAATTVQSAAATGVAEGKPKVLLLFGVYTQWYKFDPVLKDCTVRVANARTDRVENLPTPGALAKYSLIILSDVTADSLSEAWIGRLTEFTARGGRLLFLGGPFTYGLGHFREKKLDALLPVDVEVFDLKWEKQGQAFAAAKEHPITKGLDWAGKPMVYWIHKVKPKAGAETVLTAGDYPLLVTGRHEQGKVAAFLGTPLGLPQAGQKPFWEWDGWPKLMANTIAWLLAKEP